MKNKYCFSRITSQTIILLSGLFVIFLSCDKKKSAQSDDVLLVDSLTSRMSILRDSLDHAWDEMIKDDDEKLEYMKRLLNEVTYVSNYDEQEYNKLTGLVDSLRAFRYNRESMRSSRLIDQYDSATNAVTRMVTDFAYESPVFEESDLMKELIEDIHSKNGMILIYRVHYDAFAEEINEIVDKHGDILQKHGHEYHTWPLFKIPPDEV